MYWLDTGAQPTDSKKNPFETKRSLQASPNDGAKEEEIAAALSEWKAYRDSAQDVEIH